ncbi:MAG: recombinase RecA [Acidimicrobiia bacterium]
MSEPSYIHLTSQELAEHDAFPVPTPHGGERGNTLYADVAALLDGTIPEPPEPTILYRSDGHGIFYEGQVNVLFGDPESGKTMVAEAAAAATMLAGKRVLFLDLDHNGLQSTVVRFMDMGVPEEILRDLDRFRYVEPEDRLHLLAVIEDAKRERWPHLAIVDSLGELLPLMGLNSNSPDDFTMAHGLVLKPLAMTGAGVIGIDHLPKNQENKINGPTGTAAKRRAIGGVAIRVVVKEQFTPGKGGSAYLTLNKDRHGGLRRWCPTEGREPVVGLFTLESRPGELICMIHAPEAGDASKAEGVSDEDLAELDLLDPPPTSVRDVKERLRWRSDRAANALRHWRSRVPTPLGGEQGNTPSSVPQAFPGNGEREGER